MKPTITVDDLEVATGFRRPEVAGKDIFLSYASEDRDRIAPLVNALESMGWTVFWDRTVPAGKNWRQVIGDEIRLCHSVVAVWTKASVGKEWVQEEAEEGKRRRILVPVVLDPVQPPFGFGGIQASDLVGWDGSSSAPPFQRLVNDLRAVAGLPPPAPPQKEAPHEPPAMPSPAQQQAAARFLEAAENHRTAMYLMATEPFDADQPLTDRANCRLDEVRRTQGALAAAEPLVSAHFAAERVRVLKAFDRMNVAVRERDTGGRRTKGEAANGQLKSAIAALRDRLVKVLQPH